MDDHEPDGTQASESRMRYGCRELSKVNYFYRPINIPLDSILLGVQIPGRDDANVDANADDIRRIGTARK